MRSKIISDNEILYYLKDRPGLYPKDIHNYFQKKYPGNKNKNLNIHTIYRILRDLEGRELIIKEKKRLYLSNNNNVRNSLIEFYDYEMDYSESHAGMNLFKFYTILENSLFIDELRENIKIDFSDYFRTKYNLDTLGWPKSYEDSPLQEFMNKKMLRKDILISMLFSLLTLAELENGGLKRITGYINKITKYKGQPLGSHEAAALMLKDIEKTK